MTAERLEVRRHDAGAAQIFGVLCDPQWRDAGIFPVIPETALRATLGILARTVARGYVRPPG